VRGDTILSKIRPITLAAVLSLLAGLSFAADKFALTCEGIQFPSLTAVSASLVIDLDRGIVTSSLGNFSISESSHETMIYFKGNEEGESVSIRGDVDRVSGHAIIVFERSRDRQLVRGYNLSCKPMTRLF
jgi:hypothetical protein